MTHDTFRPTSVASEGTRAGLTELVVRRRALIVVGYLAASMVVFAGFGSADRPALLWWLIGLLALTSAGSEAGPRRVAMDWLPLLIIAAGYDTVRAQAPELLTRAIVTPQLRFDEIVFGGTAPTVQLQRWLDVTTGEVHWWDYVVWVGYLSHFAVSLGVAAYLYVIDRVRFKRFATLILTVSVAGFVTYFIVPAAPPWLASRQGALPHTTRIVYQVWAHLGLPGIAKVFNGSARFANPVAALPSLHAAWPLMVALFLWPTARRGRYLLVVYVAFMTFVLVYGAEHYVSDIALGWLYTGVVFWGWNRYWTRRETVDRS
jgi:PAP2 superfamily